MSLLDSTRVPTPPKEPLEPHDPKVNLMRAHQGPFKCGNCKYFNGDGNSCQWVNTALHSGDCCNQYQQK